MSNEFEPGRKGDRRPPEDPKKSRTDHPPWLQTLLLFLLFLVTLAVYYESLSGDFVNIDDEFYIHENEYIRDLSWRGIYRIFTSVIVVNYFPLQILSYSLDYAFWGMNPFGYRLTSLLFHVGNAFLIFFLFRRILPGIWLPFVGSLIFALHPVNVESVAWISERKNVLSGFFFLLSFLTYTRYLQAERKKPAYLLSLLFYLLSVLAKVSSVILPLLLILYDLCWTSRSKKEWVKDKIPFFLISAFFSWLAVHVYQMQKIIPDFHGGHPLFTFLTLANVLVEYILSLFLPVYLYFHYQTPAVTSLREYQLLLSLAFLLLIAVLAVRSYGRKRPLFFSLVWFFIPLLPVMNIVPIGIMRADRYLYLPSIGFSFFVVWAITKILPRPEVGLRRTAVALFCFLVGSYAVLTQQQCTYWKNTRNLWSRVMMLSSDHPKVYKGLGKVARDQGQLDLSILYYRQGSLLNPDDAEVLNNLADLYLLKGKLEEARDLLQRALEKDPDYTEPYINLGIIYAKWQKDSLAISAFERAMRNRKTRPHAENNLGVIYQKHGDLQKAIGYFREAVQHDPAFVLAHNNLALALRQNGDLDEGIRELHRVLQWSPHSFQTNYNLGKMYLEKGNVYKAAGFLTEASNRKPEDPDAHFQLALAQRRLPGGEDKAQFHFQKALKNEKNPQSRGEMQKYWEASEMKPQGAAG